MFIIFQKKKNRIGILENGLKPSVGDSYSSWSGTVKSIPAIFATIGDDLYDITGGLPNFKSDVWRIDTTKSNNEWFVDKHFEVFREHGIENSNIVTFSRIPRNALYLIHREK